MIQIQMKLSFTYIFCSIKKFINYLYIAFLAQKNIFLLNYNQNGVIMFWNALSGDIIGSIIESYQQITKFTLDEEREINSNKIDIDLTK